MTNVEKRLSEVIEEMRKNEALVRNSDTMPIQSMIQMREKQVKLGELATWLSRMKAEDDNATAKNKKMIVT